MAEFTPPTPTTPTSGPVVNVLSCNRNSCRVPLSDTPLRARAGARVAYFDHLVKFNAEGASYPNKVLRCP